MKLSMLYEMMNNKKDSYDFKKTINHHEVNIHFKHLVDQKVSSKPSWYMSIKITSNEHKIEHNSQTRSSTELQEVVNYIINILKAVNKETSAGYFHYFISTSVDAYLGGMFDNAINVNGIKRQELYKGSDHVEGHFDFAKTDRKAQDEENRQRADRLEREHKANKFQQQSQSSTSIRY